MTFAGAISPGWNNNGVKVCDALNAQQHPAAVADGAGCLVTWADDRGTSTDIYAYRSGGSGSVDVPMVEPDPVWFAPPYPNPTRAGVTLRFGTPVAGPARVEVLDLASRRVKTLMDDPFLAAGFHTLGWDGRDASGAAAPAGVYLVTFETTSGTGLRKLAIVR